MQKNTVSSSEQRPTRARTILMHSLPEWDSAGDVASSLKRAEPCSWQHHLQWYGRCHNISKMLSGHAARWRGKHETIKSEFIDFE